jgi:hypothetical protein
VAKYCSYRWPLRRDRASDPALADYLAGYGEALADAQCDRRQDPAAEDA